MMFKGCWTYRKTWNGALVVVLGEYDLDPKRGDKKSARVVEDFYIGRYGVQIIAKLSILDLREKHGSTMQKDGGNLTTTVTPAPAWMDHGGRGNYRNDSEHYKRGHLKFNLSP